MLIHLRFALSAQNPVVLLPPNGSRTISPSSVRNSIKKLANSRGIRAGCGVIPRCLHVFVKKSFDLVFEILNIEYGRRNSLFSSICSNSSTLCDILPLLSDKKPFSLITCSDGRFPELNFPDFKSRFMLLLYGRK